MDAEEWLLSDLQQNWVAQERFNIQEAFTNQTRKLQTDLDEFLEQLDDEFITKRQRVLAEGMFKSSSKYSATVLHIKKARQHCAEGYKSDAQRKLLLQSAGNSSVSWTEPLVTSSIAKDCARSKNRHDVSQTNQKLDELQHRLQQLKEVSFIAMQFKYSIPTDFMVLDYRMPRHHGRRGWPRLDGSVLTCSHSLTVRRPKPNLHFCSMIKKHGSLGQSVSGSQKQRMWRLLWHLCYLLSICTDMLWAWRYRDSTRQLL